MCDYGQPRFDIAGCVVRKMIQRRSFLTGLISLVAAPAIVRAGSLMPVKSMVEPEIMIRGLTPTNVAVLFRDDIFWVANNGAIFSFSGDSCHVWN